MTKRYVYFSHELKNGLTLKAFTKLAERLAPQWGVKASSISVSAYMRDYDDWRMGLAARRKETNAEYKARLDKEARRLAAEQARYDDDMAMVNLAIDASKALVGNERQEGGLLIVCLMLFVYSRQIHVNVPLRKGEGQTPEAARKKLVAAFPVFEGSGVYPREPDGPEPINGDHIVIFDAPVRQREAA